MKNINHLKHTLISISFFLCVILSSEDTHSAIAGHVILTKGKVVAVSIEGNTRDLKRRSKIMSGDVIKTGPSSSIQVRFIDKALMTIKESTEINITKYQLGKPEKNINEQALMKLVKGGFRTISGNIGKGEKSAYRVDTPAASIGIRGTNYEVQQEPNGDFVFAVYSGGINVENKAGSIQLGLDADYNFTRVKKNESPKGLLSAPETLSENSATDTPETEETEELIDESTDTENKDPQEEPEGEQKASESNDETHEDGSNIDTESEIETSADSSTVEQTTNSNNEQSEEQVAALPDITETASSVSQESTEALDEQLSEAVLDSKDELEDALIDSGFLVEGETLNDLDAQDVAILEDVNSLDDIATAANNLSFVNLLYTDLAFANSLFPESYTSDTGIQYDIITQPEANLAASKKLGVMVMHMEYNQDAAGDITFNFSEASVKSPNLVTTDASGNFANGLPAGITELKIQYDILDTTTNTITEQPEITIPINVAIDDQNGLLAHIQAYLPADIVASLNVIDSTTSEFMFDPSTDPDHFLMKLKFEFSGPDADLLATNLGGTAILDNDDWRSEVDVQAFIESGAWELSADGKGNPIIVMSDTTEQDGNTLIRNEVVKPYANAVTKSNLASFTACGDTNTICSIQVNKDDDNIRWGAWLTEPGKGIQIFEQTTNPDGSKNPIEVHSEDKLLAFWLAAERADINTLQGTANFSSSSLDCLDYNQCIGLADDGLVQNLTGSFDVDFSNGAITNGNLTIDVSNNVNINTATGAVSPGTVSSTWNVNFNGQMAAGQPEFITHDVGGTVTGSTGSVIGNIGGIFVKPGDKFAGGYNLGTTDGPKHVSGVFTLDKQP